MYFPGYNIAVSLGFYTEELNCSDTVLPGFYLCELDVFCIKVVQVGLIACMSAPCL